MHRLRLGLRGDVGDQIGVDVMVVEALVDGLGLHLRRPDVRQPARRRGGNGRGRTKKHKPEESDPAQLLLLV